MTDRVWVSSNGGPLLLLPVAHLSEWQGIRSALATNAGGAGDASSDYERACAVADYTAVIPVGRGYGLVLGDEPNDTTWVLLERGGILARWVYAEGAEQAETALASITPDLAWDFAGSFQVTDSPVELFDSAESGSQALGERLRIDLAAGTYEIARADYKPDAETWFQLVRLR